MKKIIGLFVVILLASCGASRDAKTKQKIREHYPKTVQQTEHEYPREELKIVAKEETETLEATSKVNVSRNSVEEYIDVYKELDIKKMRAYKIPASINMAQSMPDAGSGNGRLTPEAHNHFGTKGKTTWTGKPARYTGDAPA